MKRRHGYRLHVGSASILLVFITLCLVSFAILTLANANADYRLSARLAERTVAYYEAVSEAEIFIAETDKKLNEIYRTSEDESTYTEAVINTFGDTSLNAVFAINDVQSVSLGLECVYPDSSEADITASCIVITRFNVITDESVYEYDDSLFHDIP